MKKSAATTVTGFSTLALAGLMVQPLKPTIAPPAQVSGLDAHESHASASLLGQFRTNISAWLWLRTDLYLHNGVTLRPRTEFERAQGKRAVGSGDELGKYQGDDNNVTVIPSKEHDFRGWIGDLERATGAYKDMSGHKHNSPQSTLPLFRLMTWADPQFVKGWTTGATVICWGKHDRENKAKKALEFLKEGLRQNPDNVSILAEYGGVYQRRLHKSALAIPYFDHAISVGSRQFDHLSPEEQESLQDAYRWSVIIRFVSGLTQESRAVAAQGLKFFKDDRVLFRVVAAPPMPLSERNFKGLLDTRMDAFERHAKPEAAHEDHDEYSEDSGDDEVHDHPH
ncbi:MAG: hypothetical protein JST40_00265 [Armatimonadetes bacterium]|nr:hypothetical protein [Armatimonadota bacterium]